MAPLCRVCHHADRDAIDQALVSGTPRARISDQYGVSIASLHRHVHNHIPQRLAKAQAAAEAASAGSLLGKLNSYEETLRDLVIQGQQGDDGRLSIQAVRELLRLSELLARLKHEIDDRPVVNIVVAPEWLAVRAAMMGALIPYPEARAAVGERLEALEAGPS